MKLLAVFCLVYITVHKGEAVIKCIKGDGTNMAAQECSGSDTKCEQAKFVEYTGLASGVQYGCGDCSTRTAETCKSCDGNDNTACNIKIETGADFQCYDYERKDGKLVKKDAVTCKRLKTTAIKCNKPGKSADQASYTVKHNGCGGCTDADKNANKCAECGTDKCNKAFAISALVLPLIATLYTLL